jgi:hypothetical protein
MSRVRRFWSAVWVALALAVGQQAALLHDLGHAVKRIHAPTQDQYPASHTCDKCFGFSQLSGTAPGGVHALALAADSLSFTSFAAIVAPSRTVVATRSRAPPAVL